MDMHVVVEAAMNRFRSEQKLAARADATI